MRTMIYIAVALILITGLIPPSMGNVAGNDQEIRIILQSREDGASAEQLDESAKVITTRLKNPGF